MKLEEHEQRCVEVLGLPYTEVHVFLDQFFPKFRGVDHRRILHNEEGVTEVLKRFGIAAVDAAELHIMDDWYGYCRRRKVPTLEELDFDDWLFINEQTRLYQDELIKEIWTEKVRNVK